MMRFFAFAAAFLFIGQAEAAYIGAPTQYNVLIGGAAGVTTVAPSATSGVPLISQGSATNPTFGTAVVAGGGTGVATIPVHTIPIGAGTSAILNTTATAGSMLSQTTTSADPTFTATPVLGVASTTAGTLGLYSTATANAITMQNLGATAAYNWNFPLTSGTSGFALLSGGGGSTAMTWGAVATWANTDYTSNTTPVTLAATNWLYESIAQGTPAAITINLPATPANLTYQCVKDRANNFATFNATVKTTDSATIDMVAGATGYIMNQKNQAQCFLFQSAIGANGNWSLN